MAHVLPVPDDAVFHGIGDLEEGTDSCGLVANHDVFYFEVVHAFFCTEDWAADDGGERVLREVGAGIAKLPLSAFLHPEHGNVGRKVPCMGYAYLDESGAIVEDDGHISHGVIGQQQRPSLLSG